MADYYPLIARAISGLDANAPGEQRRALYERARTALIAQLRSVEPPLSETEITRERLSLEEAVRKVESEAAQRAREASRGGGSRSGDAFRASTRAAMRSQEMRSQDTTAPPPPHVRARANVTPQPRNLRADPPPGPLPSRRPPAPPTPTQDSPLAARERQGPPRRNPEPDRPPSSPVPGFSDVTADADDLGRAAAQANRSARRTYANVPSPSPEFDRLEPSLEDRGAFDRPHPYDAETADDQPPALPRSWPQPGRDKPGRGFGGGFPFKSAIAVGLVLILAGAGIVWGPKAVSAVRGLFDSSREQTVQTPQPASPGMKPKITDRVGQPSSSETLAPVAQRVVLYDEDPSDPKGKQYVGTVVWRTEEVKGAAGKTPEIAVRADIDIPERNFKMTMSFRRNTDTSLPASHTAELTFVLPPDFDDGGVANVPGILMKSNEQARGTPLAGLAVKVTDGFFLVGLSNVESDRARNLQLLKERSWFDVPLVYTNQRRAIIAIEKGAPGERAFNEAFAAWGE
jgi:hypothetical protein